MDLDFRLAFYLEEEAKDWKNVCISKKKRSDQK